MANNTVNIEGFQDVGLFTRTYLGPFNPKNDRGIRSYSWITSLVVRILSCCRICSGVTAIEIIDIKSQHHWKYFNKDELRNWATRRMMEDAQTPATTPNPAENVNGMEAAADARAAGVLGLKEQQNKIWTSLSSTDALIDGINKVCKEYHEFVYIKINLDNLKKNNSIDADKSGDHTAFGITPLYSFIDTLIRERQIADIAAGVRSNITPRERLHNVLQIMQNDNGLSWKIIADRPNPASSNGARAQTLQVPHEFWQIANLYLIDNEGIANEEKALSQQRKQTASASSSAATQSNKKPQPPRAPNASDAKPVHFKISDPGNKNSGAARSEPRKLSINTAKANASNANQVDSPPPRSSPSSPKTPPSAPEDSGAGLGDLSPQIPDAPAMT